MCISDIIPGLYSDSDCSSLHGTAKYQSLLIPLKYDRNLGFAALLRKSLKRHSHPLLFLGKHSLHKSFAQRLSGND